MPYCPLCQVSFTRADMTAYVLSCNHPVCIYCLNKQSVSLDYYQCYFDGTYTQVNSVRELTGLASFLSNELGEVMEITMKTQALRMDEMLRRRFNINYAKTNIPCRTQNCTSKCEYDHTKQFYKKKYCPLGYACLNVMTCIFLHPGETTQTSSFTPSSTPRPSAVAAAIAPVKQSYRSAQSDYDPKSYYDTVTYSRPLSSYYSSDLPTVENPWQCPNCHSCNDAMFLSCPHCTYSRS